MSSNPILDQARAYLAAGLSVIPVRADGSKAPVEAKWDRYNEKRASDRDLVRWFDRGGRAGIGVCGGKASGNLAVLDFETTDAYIDWRRIVPADTTDALSECPVVRTPSGGYHVWVRLSEPSAGTVLARRPDPEDASRGKVLIEVRGDGHQVLAPGCPAECHKTGKLYKFVERGWLDTPASGPVPIAIFVSWMDVAASLNQWTPATKEVEHKPRPDRDPKHTDPGTDFNRRGTWAETGLFEAGWVWAREIEHDRGFVRRPGKEDGISGTLGMISSRANHWPFFWPFTTNCDPFRTSVPVDRFGVYTRLKHAGDFAAAARALLAAGYGVATASLRPPATNSSASTNNGHQNNGPPDCSPDVARDGDDRVEITLTADLHINAQQVLDALADRDGGLFQFERRLVHIRRGVDPPSFLRRTEEASSIETVTDDHLGVRVSSVAAFVTWKEKKGGELEKIPKQPPERLVRAARSIPTNKIRPLTAIVTAPTLRPDGSILREAGYDRSTGLFFDATDCPPIDVPDRPTRSQVERAVETLTYPLLDFPFAEECHKAAAVAAILTLVGRWTFAGSVPLFLVDANRAGTGKGLLVDLCVIIATGIRPAAMASTSDDDEMRKRLISLALAGEMIVKIDNVPEHESLGTASLDSAITAGVIADRILGRSETVKVPMRAVWWASGNNVRLFGDMGRRTCHVRLETALENPEERPDVKEQHLLDHVRAERGKYLSAALTILRGWFAAGKPARALPTWGSFEAWSGVIRQACVWAGLVDPYATRALLLNQADPVASAFRVLVLNWGYLDPGGMGVTSGEIIQAIQRPDGDPTEAERRDGVKEAILELCPGKGDGLPSTKTLGKKLASLKGRVSSGLRLLSFKARHGFTTWVVRRVGESGELGETTPRPSREKEIPD